MAVYMSATRQRRRMIVVALAALLVGLVAGLVLGRQTSSNVNDALGQSRDRGQRLAAALRALPLEYEQAQQGTAGESHTAIDDAVGRVVRQSTDALDHASWLGRSERER